MGFKSSFFERDTRLSPTGGIPFLVYHCLHTNFATAVTQTKLGNCKLPESIQDNKPTDFEFRYSDQLSINDTHECCRLSPTCLSPIRANSCHSLIKKWHNKDRHEAKMKQRWIRSSPRRLRRTDRWQITFWEFSRFTTKHGTSTITKKSSQGFAKYCKINAVQACLCHRIACLSHCNNIDLPAYFQPIISYEKGIFKWFCATFRSTPLEVMNEETSFIPQVMQDGFSEVSIILQVKWRWCKMVKPTWLSVQIFTLASLTCYCIVLSHTFLVNGNGTILHATTQPNSL